MGDSTLLGVVLVCRGTSVMGGGPGSSKLS